MEREMGGRMEGSKKIKVSPAQPRGEPNQITPRVQLEASYWV